MNIAYLISAHNDPQHLKRLITALGPNVHCFIHIDRKTDITLFTSIISSDNVHFIPRRTNVVWGSINEVEYQMEMIRAALAHPVTFDRLVTISGLDYPVWSAARISRFFEENNGKEFLSGIELGHLDKASQLYRRYRFLTSKPWKNGSLPNKFRVLLRHIVSALGIRKPLTFSVNGKVYHLYKGAAWWAISQELAAFILKEWDCNEALKQYFKTSFCPAETFSQTVVFNSEWREKCIEFHGEWPTLAVITPLTYIYYHPVIKILTEEDHDAIKQSDRMFARKMVSGKSDRLIEIIEKEKKEEKENEK